MSVANNQINQVVEEFPAPPAYYKNVAALSPPSITESDCYTSAFGGAFSNVTLNRPTFDAEKDYASVLKSHLRNIMLLAVKVTSAVNLDENQTRLDAVELRGELTKFHLVLGEYRIHEGRELYVEDLRNQLKQMNELETSLQRSITKDSAESGFDVMERLPVKKRKVTFDPEEHSGDTTLSDEDDNKQRSRQPYVGHVPSPVVPYKDRLWDRMFSLLMEYSETNGHCKIPLSFRMTDKEGKLVNLGKWLGTQRQYKRKNLLDGNKLQRLQALVDSGKLEWGAVKADCDEERWETCFSLLLQFKEENGHCNVPERVSVPLSREDPSGEKVALGKWLDRQRLAIRANKMRSDRLSRLSELIEGGFLLTDESKEDDRRWLLCYTALRAFSEAFRHCNVPYKCDVEVEWVDGEGSAVKSLKVMDFAIERIDLTNTDANHLNGNHNKSNNNNNVNYSNSSNNSSIDSSISSSGSSSSGGGGRSLVPSDPEEVEGAAAADDSTTVSSCRGGQTLIKLGRWLACQRHFFNRKKSVRKDRLDMLQALVDKGMLRWGEPHMDKDIRWEASFDALLRFELEPGQVYNDIPRHVSRPLAAGYYDVQVKLRDWLSKQLALRRDKKLSVDKELKLQSLVDAGVLLWDSVEVVVSQVSSAVPLMVANNYNPHNVLMSIDHRTKQQQQQQQQQLTYPMQQMSNPQLHQQQQQQHHQHQLVRPPSYASSGVYAVPVQHLYSDLEPAGAAGATAAVAGQMKNYVSYFDVAAAPQQQQHMLYHNHQQQQQPLLHHSGVSHQQQHHHANSVVVDQGTNDLFHTSLMSSEDIDIRQALESMRGPGLLEEEDINELHEFYLNDESDVDS